MRKLDNSEYVDYHQAQRQQIQGAAAPSFYTRSIFTAHLILCGWKGWGIGKGAGGEGERKRGKRWGPVKNKIARSAKIQ